MFSGGHFVGPARRLDPPSFDFSYTDFVSVLLTILAVMLAALAIGIGLVAFRTIAEIKKEAGRVAIAATESVLESVPDRVSSAVQTSVEEQLPETMEAKLVTVIENAGKTGVLDTALQKALARMAFGGAQSNSELAEGFDPENDREGDDA
jgi:hypothetical protein